MKSEGCRTGMGWFSEHAQLEREEFSTVCPCSSHRGGKCSLFRGAACVHELCCGVLLCVTVHSFLLHVFSGITTVDDECICLCVYSMNELLCSVHVFFLVHDFFFTICFYVIGGC